MTLVAEPVREPRVRPTEIAPVPAAACWHSPTPSTTHYSETLGLHVPRISRFRSPLLETEQGLRDRFGVPGATVYHPAEDRFTVLIDEVVADGNPGFYRFTVAEELGHIRLHQPVLRRIRTISDAVALQLSSDYEYMDRNAKWFASALLMPQTPLLRDAQATYAGLVKQLGFDRPELARRSLVIRLSQRYVVNVSPME